MQLILAVSDLGRSVEFYERAFGWPRNPAVNFGNYVELLSPEGGALGLYERHGFAAEVGAEPMQVNGDVAPAYMYVRVDDVETACDRLRSAGARSLSDLRQRDWGESAAWFADPDGHVVAVAQQQA